MWKWKLVEAKLSSSGAHLSLEISACCLPCHDEILPWLFSFVFNFVLCSFLMIEGCYMVLICSLKLLKEQCQ